LLNALTALVMRQQDAIQDGRPEDLIDVVSLSLGYYHELPNDSTFDPLLMGPLSELSRLGVAVVASAGNEATYRPMFPAAFTPHPGGLIPAFDAACVPLISVGALNPDGSVALFSNAGDWVSCHRPGANLVSTFPETFNASARSGYEVRVDGELRATIDPDNFSSGFGTWSGTSFAGPILAGELAQALIDGAGHPAAAPDPSAAVERGWAAVTACTGLARP
jgi:subtilisin family serine protease